MLIVRIVQRLYPVIPVNSRVALVDTILPLGGGGGWKVSDLCEERHEDSSFPYSTHRRTDMYGLDVMEFKPERWEHLRTR